jgi:hypothetical protein
VVFPKVFLSAVVILYLCCYFKMSKSHGYTHSRVVTANGQAV